MLYLRGTFRLLIIGILTVTGASQMQAQGRNRVNEWLMRELRRDSGRSASEISSVASFSPLEDVEILPGLFSSAGAVRIADLGGRQIVMAHLFNEGRVGVCARALIDITGSVPSTARRSDALGLNFLVEPDSSVQVLVLTWDGPRREVAVQTAYYLWLPAPVGTPRRCSSVAPPDLDQWLNRREMGSVRVTPELQRVAGIR